MGAKSFFFLLFYISSVETKKKLIRKPKHIFMLHAPHRWIIVWQQSNEQSAKHTNKIQCFISKSNVIKWRKKPNWFVNRWMVRGIHIWLEFFFSTRSEFYADCFFVHFFSLWFVHSYVQTFTFYTLKVMNAEKHVENYTEFCD